MMLFWKARLVLLAVPKTGTQAYEKALAAQADVVMRHPTWMKHANAMRFRNKYLPLMDPDGKAGLETAAVIREPRDWLGSWFRYRSRPQLNGHKHSTAGLSFADFIEAYLSDSPPPFAQVGAQARFVSNPAGKVLVDHLFAYEDQAPLQAFLRQRLKADVTPPRHNVSPQASLTLPAPLEARLRTEREVDFQLYEAVRSGFFLP